MGEQAKKWLGSIGPIHWAFISVIVLAIVLSAFHAESAEAVGEAEATTAIAAQVEEPQAGGDEANVADDNIFERISSRFKAMFFSGEDDAAIDTVEEAPSSADDSEAPDAADPSAEVLPIESDDEVPTDVVVIEIEEVKENLKAALPTIDDQIAALLAQKEAMAKKISTPSSK